MGYEHCGLYFPAKWWQTDGSKYWCKVDWNRVKEHDPTSFQMYAEIFKTDNPALMPEVGCGCKFIPWSMGASKILELRDQQGNWFNLVAARLPVQLDDEIKKVKLAWHRACGRLSAEDLFKAVPSCFPKLNSLKDHPKLKHLPFQCDWPGMARFDIQAWERQGRPTLEQAGWVALCECIAIKDTTNLGHLITLCSEIKEQQKEWPLPSDAGPPARRRKT